MPEVRLITPITRQNTKKMQVAAYCRVSSNSADQLNSYAAQIRAYKKCIGARDDWELVDIFADEGLTGMKSETRDEFQRMIRMCELKQIDLIITKSISRFARNTKDALAYVRKLKLLGVGVQFEKEGISTLSMGDEMLLNTFSALAQEESQSISMNQRLSIVKRMELGEYVDSNAPYGYRLVDKALAVYEPEAAVVRDIFDLYLRGFSISEIGRELKSRNIPTKAGKESWHPYRIAYMLKNERYIGDSFYQKLTVKQRSHSTSISTADRKIASMPKEHIPVSLTSMCSMLFSSLSKNARRLSPEQLPKISIRLQAAFSVLSAALSIGEGVCRVL